MYETLIKEYLKRLSLKDINNFANKNNIKLANGEDKVIYDFIMNNWKQVYEKNDFILLKLKSKLSKQTYETVITLYNEFKNKIK